MKNRLMFVYCILRYFSFFIYKNHERAKQTNSK